MKGAFYGEHTAPVYLFRRLNKALLWQIPDK